MRCLKGTGYTTNITTATIYIGNAVYESRTYSNVSLDSLEYDNRLQFIGHEEGRSHGFSENALESSGVFSPSVTIFLNSQTYNSSKPKAFLNWVLFDEQFNFVANSSGFEQVGASDEYKTHVRSDLTASKNGYLYIYVSNVTENIDVFFDNLWVTHVRGPILEETHYYPFGLTMAGISSKALSFGNPQNRRKFNYGSELANGEFSDGSGLEMYETKFRGLDPQVGRWWQRDPLAEFHYGISPYAYVLNNPITYNDPLGLDTTRTSIVDGRMNVPKNPDASTVLSITNADGSVSYYNYDPNNPNANSQGYVGAGTENTEQAVVVTAKAKPKEGSNSQPWAWSPLAGFVNNSVNTAGGYFENFYNPKATLGYGFKSPWYKLKLYPSEFRGNQYVSTFNIAKAGKLAGTITFGVGTAIDGYGVYTYYTQGSENPNAVHPAKAGANLGVGIYGLYGAPPGWIAGTIYFVGDATLPGGWEGGLNKLGEIQEYNSKVLGKHWNPHRD